MSLHQSRSDKNESQFRRTGGGRSGQHRTFSGGSGKGGGGGSTTAPPLSTNSSSLSYNRSFKKTNNVQGGHSKTNVGYVNTSVSNTAAAVAHSTQNGSHVQPQPPLHGATNQAPSAAPKPSDASAQKSSRPIPKAPSSHPSTINPGFMAPPTPAKGDSSKTFPLQFGSISPGLVNGVQVPARTSSAPPNLDEQKREQAHHESLRAPPPVSIPSVPKQKLPKKDVAPSDQLSTGWSCMDSKPEKDIHIKLAVPQSQSQKPSTVPVTGISPPMPFRQSPVSMHFGGPNPQIQSQAMLPSSLQMSMQMQMQIGTPTQVPQQVFMPGLQHHLMQPQGMMPQSMGFNPQMGPPAPHQMGNMGRNIPSHFPQQQAGRLGNARKTVKITHPDTHEELRLDKMTDIYTDGTSSASRMHHNAPQPVPSYTPTHPSSYYSSSYNAGPPLFPARGTHPLTSSRLPSGSQLPRFNYPVSQAPQTASFLDRSTPNLVGNSRCVSQSHEVSESARLDHPKEVQIIVSPAQVSLPVTIKTASVSTGEQVSDSKVVDKLEPPNVSRSPGEPGSTHVGKNQNSILDDSLLQSKTGTDHFKPHPPVITSEAGRAPETTFVELASAVGNADGRGERPDTDKDNQRQEGKKGHSQPTLQVVGQSTPAPSSSDPLKKRDLESPEAEAQGTADLCQKPASTASGVSSEVSGHQVGGIHESGDSFNCGTNQVDGEKDNLDLCKSNSEGLENVTSSLKATEVIHCCRQVTDLKEKVQEIGVPAVTHGGDTMTSCSMAGDDSVGQRDVSKPNMSDGKIPSNTENHLETSSKPDDEVIDNHKPSTLSAPVPNFNKFSSEPNKAKNTVGRGKKKQKEILQKADAAGMTKDLYMAYRGPEEKKETAISADDIPLDTNKMVISADARHENVISKEKEHPGKPEPDDWEDAADLSKLEASCDAVDRKMMLHGEEEVTTIKYSRDFLLTFSEQCIDPPPGLSQTKSDIADSLMHPHVNTGHLDREHPSPGRILGRPSGAARVFRPGGGMMEPDRLNKTPVALASDLGYGKMGFRPGHGVNFGVLKNFHAHVPVQYPGGILPGPMQPIVVQHNNSDSDRWRRAANFDNSLMQPYTPLKVMHKAERKYEVGKITDEEQAKQRRLKGILNKLTPQNFEKLFEQVKEVNIDNAVTLDGVISQIFDKALMEPTFCEMYANFCYYLASELPDLSVDNEKITFKRLLLNKCQEEFERGEREEEEANKVEDEGEAKQSEEEREEKRLKARRLMLGNIRLIGELYKKRMLTERIMHECIKKLLGHCQNPDEENIEALCRLMSTIGEMIDHPKAKDHMDVYFDIMAKLSTTMKLSSRVRFMLKDAIDLRRNKWQQRRKVEGPKKIEDVHRDAAQERHAQTSRLSRGPSMNSSMRRGQPVDFSPRGSSMLSSPVTQTGSFRGLPPQPRGFSQDAHVDESAFESRILSVPLPHRPLGDDSITLGPQGGLARGMSTRGKPDVSSSHLETRRMAGGLNGHSSVSERPAYGSREDLLPRFGGPTAYDQSRSHEPNPSYVNRDHQNIDRDIDQPRPASPSVKELSPAQNTSSDKASAEKVWPEEHLQNMSIAAIKKFYSAKDEKEVALCLKELNAPSFYPTVVSIWVSDSFERKDIERDMLAKLLVNLSRPEDGIFSHVQLVKGFASVLTTFEDMVTDAPKAPEFLGRLFAKAILENVISLRDIGQLLHDGGEEPGCLREAGLAGDVLGCTLESIKSEKGEATLKEIHANSDLQLENFRPPHPLKSKKLELFI